MHHFGALKRFADLEFTILAVIWVCRIHKRIGRLDEFRWLWIGMTISISARWRPRDRCGRQRSMEVNPSTVSRRLEHFEERLGVQLFTRSRRGLTITPEGAEVIARVNEIASDLGNIEGRLIGQDQRLSGVVRVVIPEVIALSLLVKELPRFQALYPDIEISMVPGHQRPNLNVREADVLMEATDHPAENLVGRSLSPVAIAAYGSRDLVERDQQAGIVRWRR